MHLTLERLPVSQLFFLQSISKAWTATSDSNQVLLLNRVANITQHAANSSSPFSFTTWLLLLFGSCWWLLAVLLLHSDSLFVIGDFVSRRSWRCCFLFGCFLVIAGGSSGVGMIILATTGARLLLDNVA